MIIRRLVQKRNYSSSYARLCHLISSEWQQTVTLTVLASRCLSLQQRGCGRTSCNCSRSRVYNHGGYPLAHCKTASHLSTHTLTHIVHQTPAASILNTNSNINKTNTMGDGCGCSTCACDSCSGCSCCSVSSIAHKTPLLKQLTSSSTERISR